MIKKPIFLAYGIKLITTWMLIPFVLLMIFSTENKISHWCDFLATMYPFFTFSIVYTS